MCESCQKLGAELRNASLPVGAEEQAEAAEFLDWLADDNFTFLGYREYRYRGGSNGGAPDILPGSGQGLLRDDAITVFDGLRNFAGLSPEVRAFLMETRILSISKSNRRSSVHRPVRMDTVAVRKFGADGQAVGDRLFVGLFTSQAYAKSPLSIPVLRHKVTPHDRARGVREIEPRREGLAAYPRSLSARRAVPDLRGRASRYLARHLGLAGAPAHGAVRAARSVSPLRLGLRLCSARALQHRAAPALRGDPGKSLSRPRRQFLDAARRIGAGARPFHRDHAARTGRGRSGGGRARSRRSGAKLVRPFAGSAGAGARRRKRARRSSVAMARPSRRTIASISRPRHPLPMSSASRKSAPAHRSR